MSGAFSQSATGLRPSGGPYQAFPLPVQGMATEPQEIRGYGADHSGPPEPFGLPWALRSLSTANYGVDTLEDGRTRYWIRHQVLRGVTPRMLAWWFAHLEGTVDIGGMRVNRYRAWHPADHVHASYARRLPDGSIGPGAVLRLREMLGGNPRFTVNVCSVIEKLDEEGFIHNPIFHGIRGLVRMEYRFKRVPEGTAYENCLVFGARGALGRLVHPFLERIVFPPLKGRFWLRHNIEEVGMFEHFLPQLYRSETGLAA
ncbi:MAG: hypothetical protein K0Q43_2621 [Ramlibacter sp.]|nr:hypothetical protein [Ramlibacter sp.]